MAPIESLDAAKASAETLARPNASIVGSDQIELDHLVPWSKGGQHSLDNLRVLCKPCNRRKGARMPEDA